MKCYIRELDNKADGWGPWRKGSLSHTGRDSILVAFFDSKPAIHRHLSRAEPAFQCDERIAVTGFEAIDLNYDNHRFVRFEVSPGHRKPADEPAEDDE